MAAWKDVKLSKEEIRLRKKEALIGQAAAEFRKRGYHATSMDDIAAALGVTKGALYRYVKSKDEVLYECFKHSNKIGDQALARAAEMEGTAAERLHCFLREFIKSYLESNLAGGAMVEIDSLLPSQRSEVVQGRDRIDRRLRALIEEGIADGTIASESPKLLIFSFMGAINWIPSWFSPEGEFSSEQIAEQVSRIFMNGIATR